jgi:hypothetical protein|tara:strand:+ start:463 stop:663 length:201 start_codon:yes stop_codon:yes gene_type:complete
MVKKYKVKFKEYEKDEEQVMEVKTEDIDFLIVQLGRNRSIETISYQVLDNVNYDNDILGPNGNLGI